MKAERLPRIHTGRQKRREASELVLGVGGVALKSNNKIWLRRRLLQERQRIENFFLIKINM